MSLANSIALFLTLGGVRKQYISDLTSEKTLHVISKYKDKNDFNILYRNYCNKAVQSVILIENVEYTSEEFLNKLKNTLEYDFKSSEELCAFIGTILFLLDVQIKVGVSESVISRVINSIM